MHLNLQPCLLPVYIYFCSVLWAPNWQLREPLNYCSRRTMTGISAVCGLRQLFKSHPHNYLPSALEVLHLKDYGGSGVNHDQLASKLHKPPS